MAARTGAVVSTSTPEPVDLRHVSARDMEPLLEEEIAAWRESLDWDFVKSAELVLRFVGMRALCGYALVVEGKIAGYTYYVNEDYKALIGDLYVARRFRRAGYELQLLGRAVADLTACPHIRRIESQLMILDPSLRDGLPRADALHSYDRNYMSVELASGSFGAGRVTRPVYLSGWEEHYQDATAQLIAEAYAGHVDGLINDQYRTVNGARRFLRNIVQHPGCGAFYRPASWAAFEGESGRLCGVSLCSLVAPHCGHITQLCVSPAVRARGVGHALIRQSLLSLQELGCSCATLTVTASNTNAVELYQRLGFRTVRRFRALVWEGF